MEPRIPSNLQRALAVIMVFFGIAMSSPFIQHPQESDSMENSLDAGPDPQADREHEIGFAGRHWVTITAAPPRVLTVRVGSSVELECQGSGSPPPSITWLRDGGVLELKSGSSPNLNRINDVIRTNGLAHTVSRMVIDCITPHHEGVYTCLATAGSKTASANTVLRVESDLNFATMFSTCSPKKMRGVPAVVTQWTKTYLDLMGNNAVLTCRSSGEPKPLTLWLDPENNVVTTDGKHKVLSNGDLLITSLSWSDMGGYTCIAENAFGRDSASTFVYPVKREDS